MIAQFCTIPYLSNTPEIFVQCQPSVTSTCSFAYVHSIDIPGIFITRQPGPKSPLPTDHHLDVQIAFLLDIPFNLSTLLRHCPVFRSISLLVTQLVPDLHHAVSDHSGVELKGSPYTGHHRGGAVELQDEVVSHVILRLMFRRRPWKEEGSPVCEASDDAS